MAFPGFYVFRNSLFNARSGCGGHKESMLMVFSSPYAFSSYYIAVGIFSYILGFVYPFFQHEVLFKEVLQFVCRVAEDVEVDSVFSFIEYPVGLVVGSQCGFVDFLDGTDGAFCFVEVCQWYLFAAGNEFVVFICQYKQDVVHPIFVLFSRYGIAGAVVVGFIVFICCVFISCGQLHLYVHVHCIFRFVRHCICFTPAFGLVGLPQLVMVHIANMLIKNMFQYLFFIA